MPYDVLMRPVPTASGAGITINNAALGGLTGPHLVGGLYTALDFGGANMELESHLRLGGAAPTGTGVSAVSVPPTGLTVKYQESDDGSTSWTDIPGAAHPAQGDTMVEKNVTGAVVLSRDPSRITFRTSKRYVRAHFTILNADNIFPEVTIGLQPTMGSRPTSGKS